MINSVTDCAIRIKNGYMSKKETIIVLYSKMNLSILSVLKNEGYIKDFALVEKTAHQVINVTLLYHGIKPSVQEIKVISSPGRRIYTRTKDIKPILGGLGRAILSTPKGIMTDIDAKKQQLGGELLFKIW